MSHLEHTTYIRHLVHAAKLSSRLLLMAIVGIVHAFVPYIFPDFVSSKVKEMDEMLDNPII